MNYTNFTFAIYVVVKTVNDGKWIFNQMQIFYLSFVWFVFELIFFHFSVFPFFHDFAVKLAVAMLYVKMLLVAPVASCKDVFFIYKILFNNRLSFWSSKIPNTAFSLYFNCK